MKVRWPLLAIVVLAVATPVDAQESPVPPVPIPPVVIGPDTVTVRAGSPGTLAVVAAVGPRGPGVRCAWFDLILGPGGALSALVPVTPKAGATHMLTCVHPDDTVVAGYAVFVVYDPANPLPGPAVSTEEAALFALRRIRFEPPAPALSPAARQVVGVETWLGVTSRLSYGEVTAQAGPVWSTVRPVFREAVWRLGDGRTVVCTADVAAVWQPGVSADAQSSDCTHTYERSSGNRGYDASATVTWTILWRNNRDPVAWRVFDALSLTTPVSIGVDQLQAAIR